jgi:Fe-S cluster assembly iron-binding protein IscA
MLALTQDAVVAVRDVLVNEELHEEGGLRISTAGIEDEAEFGLSLAAAPAEGDQVIDEDGARLFLDETAASLLDDQVLDAVVHDDHLHFTFTDQNGQS